MNEITYMILRVVVSVCVTMITLYVIPYIKTLKNDARYKSMITLIEAAVRAAEQTITGHGQGYAKKEKVMAFVRDWLASQGITITDEQLSELIEAAVYSMKESQV
jgi:LL-H family phage holin